MINIIYRNYDHVNTLEKAKFLKFDYQRITLRNQLLKSIIDINKIILNCSEIKLVFVKFNTFIVFYMILTLYLPFFTLIVFSFLKFEKTREEHNFEVSEFTLSLLKVLCLNCRLKMILVTIYSI